MAATAKINLKNMDYFKFRKYVIDGNRDESSACSKEVSSLCACVQTLNLRDDEFDPGGQDWPRFDEICSAYRQILQGKRVEALDVRIKSGWWGEQKSGLSAGKVKASLLLEVLVSKTKDWMSRHGEGSSNAGSVPLEKSIDGPGVYVFKHKERSCFQLVQSAGGSVFQKCSEFLKNSFEGNLSSPLTALFVVSLVADWDFYFMPVNVSDNEEILRVVENDLILKHDSVWPHGLNMTLTLLTTFDLAQFRRSCIRHKWPPERDFKSGGNGKKPPGRLNVDEVKNENMRMFSLLSPTSGVPTTPPDVSVTPPSSSSNLNERPSSARIQSTRAHQSNATVQPKTPRPSTAKTEQKKSETTVRSNTKSPTKSSMTEINKSHSIQSIKNVPAKRDEPPKKSKSKENKSPEASSSRVDNKPAKDLANDSRRVSGVGSTSPEGSNGNSPSQPDPDEKSPPQQLKRSNTFTYDGQDEDESEGKKTEAIARFVAAQTD